MDERRLKRQKTDAEIFRIRFGFYRKFYILYNVDYSARVRRR